MLGEMSLPNSRNHFMVAQLSNHHILYNQNFGDVSLNVVLICFNVLRFMNNQLSIDDLKHFNQLANSLQHVRFQGFHSGDNSDDLVG
jgi:hypothetical protein